MGVSIEWKTMSREQIQYLKGWAILSILLGHLGFWNRGGSIGVNLFLFISGYGCYVSFRNNGLKFFFKRKLYRIYLPYLLISAIKFPSSDLVTGKQGVLCVIFGVDFGHNRLMWYISYIFVYYTIFYICTKIALLMHENMLQDVWILFSLFIFSGIIFHIAYFRKLPVWNGSAGAGLYTYAFLAGVCSAILSQYLPLYVKGISSLSLFVISSAIFFALYANVNSFWDQLVYSAGGAVSIVCFVMMKAMPFKRLLLFMGKISYMVFLINGEMIYHIKKYFPFAENANMQRICCLTAIICLAVIAQDLFENFYAFIQARSLVRQS